jgi:hypothetical protein
MAYNVPDEYFLASVIDPGYQPALVVTDIEDNASSDIVRVLPTLLYIREVCPIGVLGNLIPGRQGGLPLRVLLAGVPDLLPADHSHGIIFAFCEVPVKRVFSALPINRK